MKLKLLAILASTLSINSFAQAITKVDDVNGLVGQALKIKVHHEFLVINTKSTTQNYLVAETAKVDGKEYKKGWGFSLVPNGSRKFSEDLFLEYPATHTGEWKIEAMTGVANSDSISWGYAKLRVN